MINYRTKVTIEYTNKKWDLDTMKIRFKNLGKIIPFNTIYTHLHVNLMNAKSELDAYYLTYYELKDIFLKYKRSSFGDTSKNIKKTHELNWNEILNAEETARLSSNYTNAYINNSIYGSYGAYDSYTTSNIVADYYGRLSHY